jgi:hypothetical protein
LGSLLKPLAALLALAAVIGGAIFGVDYYRHRFVRSDADMVKLLPPGDLTTFFADLSLLRQAGLLNVITGVKPAADKEYQEFVRQTQFDYTRDMDALAGASDGSQLFFVIRGRFDWDKLRAYALAHGGACRGDSCKAPTSTPGRWADFFPVQADVIALAVSPNNSAADLLRPPGRRVQDQPPLDPVWVKVSLSLLKDPTKLPLLLRIFAVTLQSADSVVLSAGRANGANAAFTLQLDAGFENTAAADTIRHQLDIQTKMLKLALDRENQQPNPADLTGLLTAGNFQQVEKHVVGTWPVRKELLGALE